MVVHSLTGLTPNMAMVGREVLVPVTLIAKPPEETSVVTVPFVSNLRRVRETTQAIAKTQKNVL